MGQTLRASVRQGMRKNVFVVLASIALWNAIAACAQDDANFFVELRGGLVPLRDATSVASDVAAAVAAESGDGSGGPVGVGSTVSYGRDRNERKLILIRYAGDESAWELRTALLAAGAEILDYVATNTLLTLARAEAIGLAARFGALAAEYPWSLKMPPELTGVFRAAAASAKLSQHRRQLVNGASSGGGGGNSSSGSSGRGSTTGLTENAAYSDNSLPPAASGLSRSAFATLNSLSTWSNYVRLTQSEEPSLPPFPALVGLNASSPPPQDASSDLYGVSVRLVPGLSDEARSKIAEAWPKAVTDVVGRSEPGDKCRPQVVTDGLNVESAPIMLMYFCAQDYEKGVTWLSKLDTVVWVEPALKPTLRNAVGGWIIQSGNITNALFDDPTPEMRPFWKSNIRGQGVVVGLEDSGIDMSHCHFIDDRWRTGSLRTLFVGNPPRLYMPNHRKVIQYMLPVRSGINRWFGDEPFGHGTHVAATIAGATFADPESAPPDGFVNQRSTGSAPSARLSFYDISPDNALYVPFPIDDKILPYHYAVGARIGSSSWGFGGSLAVTYNEVCRQYDSFAWRNPDFISVIAAGNDGDNGFMPTVTAPSTAKNIISVGATASQPSDFAASPYNLAILFRYRDSNGTLQSYAMWPYLGSGDATWRSLLNNKEVPFRVASPLGACSSLVGANYTGAVVLVDQATSTSASCSANQRAVNARAAGAAAVMFIAAGSGFLDGSQEQPVVLDPSTVFGMITRAEGLATVALLRNATLNVTNPHITFLTYPQINLGPDSVSYFSSYGPYIDGRFKPDIVAPGGVIESALSGPGVAKDSTSKTCSGSTGGKQGTSMATPMVAGHLALARQYFRDGFYPTGASGDTASVSFEPSGMLLKAIAIVGARSLAGGFAANAGFQLGAAPDGYQGWGRMDLSGALPLAGVSNPNFRISVADYGTANQGEWVYMSGIEATGTGPITAALVWHDYPGSGAARRNLINDLDFGYQLNGGIYTRTRADSVNNVERVELAAANLTAGDRITIVVHGRNIRHRLLTGPDAQLPQRWAVVVVGHFNGTLRTIYNPAYTRPQRYLQDTQATLSFANGNCMIARPDNSIVTSGACTAANANFTLVEEAIPAAGPVEPQVGPRVISDGGFWYSLRDASGRCVTVPGTASNTRALMAPCNASDPRQKIGLFKSSLRNGPFYQLVPSFAVRSAGSARCLRQSSSSFLLLLTCNSTDVDQIAELRPPAPGRPERTLPPSPLPPAPAPQAPAQQWYPYSLVFRVDWYPTEGKFNLNDYDYVAGHNGYGDETYGDVTDDLDIIVSWTWQNVSYTMGRYTDNAGNVSLATGVMYGGDNSYYATQYEIVYFQTGVAPPPTAFHVCVAWQFSQTPLMRAVMTVYRGYAVATAEKEVDTFLPADFFCSPDALGYLGTYDLTAPAPPPPPPSPPMPQPAASYPLYFRADWAILSGVRGRPTKTYDFDIVVAWNVGQSAYSVGALSAGAVSGAVYGGDNLRNNGTNSEEVYWVEGTVLPPTNTYHVCVRWNANSRPLALVKLSVWHDGRLTTSSTTVDTTFDWSEVCAPGAVGYIDSYWVGETRGLPDDLSYSGCLMTPAPSLAFSLYFLVQWNTVNVTAATRGAVYDWDLVISWRWGGQSYELSPYSRFVGGAVHGGDNKRLLSARNSEAAYWPTGLTGVEPSPTQYDVCVRWYQTGRLNVTMTVLLYNNVVQRVSRVWDSDAINSKTCSPVAAGYIGSYSYTGSGGGSGGAASFTGRRSALEFLNDGSTRSMGAASGALNVDDFANLVPQS